ncbi:MAG: phytanoyl-CoA dioxygenase family protein [Zavarzinella sp.]
MRDQYLQDGYLLIRNLISPDDMAGAQQEADRLISEYAQLQSVNNLRCRWQNNVFTGECTFETFDPVIDISPVCKKLAYHPSLLAVLGELYQEPACLFKDKLIFKPPGVKGYGLHQDWIAWDNFPTSFLTVLIPFEAADRDNGCTIVYPGYHHNGRLTEKDGQYHELPANMVDESRAVPLELEPGDMAIFGGFTPHRSDPNTSGGWRRQLYLSYNALSDGGEQRTKHYEEFHRYLKEKYAQYGKTETYFE